MELFSHPTIMLSMINLPLFCLAGSGNSQQAVGLSMEMTILIKHMKELVLSAGYHQYWAKGIYYVGCHWPDKYAAWSGLYFTESRVANFTNYNLGSLTVLSFSRWAYWSKYRISNDRLLW